MNLQDFFIDGLTEIQDDEASMISGGVTVAGPPGLSKKAGTGFALDKPGLIKNISDGNGFAGENAGNGANSGGDGNNGWQVVTFG
jgi:hypothetical protein